ncbi:MAG: putative phage tail sheath protein [Gammaproteobacteria bacterium]|nr:putative phage tail sheath protein [Gammaproteobacteria bacterium]
MPIFQAGTLNSTALVVPNAYIVIQPPNAFFLNGVPTNVTGIVGTAPWGPVNSPTTIGNISQYAALFGQVQNRRYDAGTLLVLAQAQGANNFRMVRVTDGTDTAAQIVVLTNCLTLASKYTGSNGNGTQVAISAGSQAGTFKAIVTLPGLVPEQFDNIGSGLAGNAVWVAIAAAINSGGSVLRGPSGIITATAGAGTTAPATATYTLAGGTDGAVGVTTANLIGQDTIPRKGMYALRNTGASTAALADCADSTVWSTQIAYGLSEGTYMVDATPASDTIANALAAKASAGIDSYAMKLCFGDWVYWLDPYNAVLRKVSPQGPALGILAALSPQNSSLNKQLQGIAGTEKSFNNQQYSDAELQQLGSAGFDLIANPSPGGAYFAMRFGRNTSSNAVIHGDNYTRMTNYIASTLNAGMGKFVGLLQSASVRRQALDTLGAYFDNLQQQGLIGDPNGNPAYSIVLDKTNNPDSRVALGYMQADIQVKYLAVIEYLLLNVTGGQSVVITRQQVALA